MRPRFEKDLRGYSEVAKDDLHEAGEAPDEADNLSAVLDWHLEKAAERQHTNKDVQKEIYDLQKRKQEIMDRLKEQLACLDNPECHFEKKANERLAQFDEATNEFKYVDDKGKKQSASFGDLVTDLDWDIYYCIDKSAPRRMIKRYLLERAKKYLRGFLDRQIIRSEVSGDISHIYKKDVYATIEKERNSGVQAEKSGFVSEMIVKNFLKKLSLDNDFLPFEVREGDVFQDVEQKIDFIIHLKEKSRGVEVEGSEAAKDVGVQFSINPDAEMNKQYQVERSVRELRANREHIQDIALVIFPLTIVRDLKNQWVMSGRRSGGPDKFMSRDIAKKLFIKLLKDILLQEEIEKAWEAVKDRFSQKG